MDSAEYKLSPKLARLRRICIIKEKRNRKIQASIQNVSENDFANNTLLPMKRSTQILPSKSTVLREKSIIQSLRRNSKELFNSSQLFNGESSNQVVYNKKPVSHVNNGHYESLDAFDDIVIDSDYIQQEIHNNNNKGSSSLNTLSNCNLTCESVTWDAGDPIHVCRYCKAMMWDGERLSKSKGSNIPIFRTCCMSGKVELPFLREAPQILQDLHFEDDERGRYFRKNIRSFNSMFCFTSMAGKINHNINNGSAPPTFSLSGQNYHSIGSLLPSPSDIPKFAQLYIYDTENEIQNRISAIRSSNSNNVIEQTIVNELKQMMDLHNPLAKSFRYARDRFKEDSKTNIKLKLIRKREKDGRRYNLPTASEVAILIVGDIDESSLQRDIILETTSNRLKRIDVLDPSYLSLQYPLIFPYGEDGFRPGIENSSTFDIFGTKKRKTISIREFFSYRIQMRLEESSILLHSRRLFQQFLVDSYTMIESERLRYLRNNQPKLRVDKYNSLHESLVRGEADAILSGQRIILPSSFTGVFWIPQLFITITCNPEWEEIKRLLHGTGLKAEDRPDIASRIFSIKLDELISDFKNGRLFGNISAYVCTVEFQKRGLPHAHILLFMQPQYKPKSPDDIDRVISAEIPDKTNMPRLYAAVEKFMVHGPCGRHNISSPCMINGRCSKFFPKPFRNRTIIDEGGFPKYKRMDNGHTITKKNAILDNSYIVPYNPDLLLKYGCHINVEHTCQTSSIKYLFKYVHKGNDRVTASFYQTSGDGSSQQVVDEIRNYYDCRYISACEAAWRIFGYEIQLKEPAVIRLPFHLPDEQPVVFKDHENIADVIQHVDGKVTKLAAWMLANREYPFARSLTYSEFPTKFVWKDDSCMWFPRKQGFSIGRLTHVPRGNGEDYYMRILLNIQRGCMSFTDLRTVDGVVYNSFKETCYALGLLQDDKEFVDAILEASTWASGNYLRNLFVVLLISNNISRPELVWQQCYQQLSEDLLHSHRISTLNPDIQLSDDQLLNMTLSKVEMMLQANGRSLREFNGIPLPDLDIIDGLDDRIIADELTFDIVALRDELEVMLSEMNCEQQNAFHRISKAVNNNLGGFFFIYGYGGTGKTFLYRALSAAIRVKGEIVLNVASSGIASLLLPKGRTAHSRFKIPLKLHEDSVCSIKQGSPLAKLICKAKLIIWDEAPMLNKICYEALDKSLKDILRSSSSYNEDLPFGDKVVVLGGDFRQILPVIPMGSRQDIVQATINSSYLWSSCKVITLSQNMRLTVGVPESNSIEIKQFAQWLLRIGDGLEGDSIDGESEVNIPEEILIKDNADGFDNIIRFVYPDILTNLKQSTFFKERTILAPTLDVVHEVNNHIMKHIEEDEKVYLSSDSMCVEEGSMESELDTFTPDVLNAINCSGLPPHELILKVGVPVMLLRNIDQFNGLCNGTRLQIPKKAISISRLICNDH
ncbi:uncharacterized protein LOC130981559 [Arachis stenosperma]|uniref:uncharacterized protein LOC130981559 n=1 Tax=Arachis stenosperma TaxID=217475 RepID=UPI0025ABA94B|nr:uncharacterized protein LOC130981559 [Arachis stenosperma]